MKQGIHPEYAPVAFRDLSTGRVLVIRSTLAGRRSGGTVKVQGRDHPVVDVDITSDSHPFWTGTARKLDTEGRVQAFERRYGGRA